MKHSSSACAVMSLLLGACGGPRPHASAPADATAPAAEASAPAAPTPSLGAPASGGGTPADAPPTITTGPVLPLHASAPNWTDYVEADGTTCLAVAGANNCEHGGEMRRVLILGQNDCAGLQAHDELGAFDWTCEPGNPVSVVSTKLRDTIGLVDLLEVSGNVATWRVNHVVVTNADNAEVFISDDTPWWGNALQVSASGAELDVAGTIYVVPAETVSETWWTIAADRVALVTQGKVMISAAYAVLSPMPTKFVWLEGSFEAQETGIALTYLSYSQVRRVSVSNVSLFALISSHIDSCHFDQIAVASSTYGFALKDSIATSVARLRLTNTFSAIQLASSQRLHLSDLSLTSVHYTASAPAAVMLTDVDDSSLVGVLVANSDGEGIRVDTDSRNTILASISIVNTEGWALSLAGSNTLVHNVVAAMTYGVSLEGTDRVTIADLAVYGGWLASFNSSNTTFTGDLSLFVGTCSVSGGQDPGFNEECELQAPSDAKVSDLDVIDSFVGPVPADEANPNDLNGGTLGGGPIDWLHFDHELRGWGTTAAFGVVAAQAPCDTASPSGCHIWDFRLKASDIELRDRLPMTSAPLSHRWSAADPSDCYTVPGAQWDPLVFVCTSTFTRHAAEIANDAQGNDNGLCETAEACRQTPNFGAYQGAGF